VVNVCHRLLPIPSADADNPRQLTVTR
jgi:hypothetical protein